MYIFLVLCVGGWGGFSYFDVCFVCVGLAGCLYVYTCRRVFCHIYIHSCVCVCVAVSVSVCVYICGSNFFLVIYALFFFVILSYLYNMLFVGG